MYISMELPDMHITFDTFLQLTDFENFTPFKCEYVVVGIKRRLMCRR